MSKSKARKAQQRRQKKNRKDKARRKAYLAEKRETKARRKDVLDLMQDSSLVPDITEDEYVFWLCHGANFLVSDQENGVWDPLFDDIYEDKLPTAENVAQRVINRFGMGEEGSPSPEALAVLAWTVSDKSAIRVYRYEALNRMSKKDPLCDAEKAVKRPANSVVWDLMNQVRDRVLAQQGAQMLGGEE